MNRSERRALARQMAKGRETRRALAEMMRVHEPFVKPKEDR